MCLISKDSELKVAIEDIVCWKMVLRRPYNIVVTPYMDHYISDSVISGNEPFVGTEIPGAPMCTKVGDEYHYESGLIHTFANLEEARMEMGWRAVGYETHECKIPKGIGYVEGVDSFGSQSFASEQIVFVRKVNGEEEK